MLYNKNMAVKIIIDLPIKLKVEKALLITFPYDIKIVEVMRGFEKKFWHPDKKMWELPFSCLETLKSQLSMINKPFDIYDQLSIISYTEQNDKFKHYNIDYKYKTKPRKHQIDGFNYGMHSEKWLLADDPGLGKTFQTLNIALAKRQEEWFKHCLIVVGVNNLKLNWVREIKIHTNEEPYVLGQRVVTKGPNKGKIVYKDNKEKMEDIINGVDNFFLIVNIESLRDINFANQLQRMCRTGEIGMVIADEIHKCLEGSSLIQTTLGELPIKDIVEKEIKCEIYSYNTKTNKIELQPIEHYHKYENYSYLLEIETEDGQILKLTPDHKVFTTNRGYVKAEDLTLEDDLIVNLQNFCSCDSINKKENTNARETM